LDTKKPKRKKLRSLKSLWDLAWDLQSEYVRRKDADFQGFGTCYTCHKRIHWKQLQAGHFIHQSYDFDIYSNIRPQCTGCNKWGHGKPLEYYIHLVSEIGEEAAEHARTRAHWNDYKRADLEELIAKYRQLLSTLPSE